MLHQSCKVNELPISQGLVLLGILKGLLKFKKRKEKKMEIFHGSKENI